MAEVFVSYDRKDLSRARSIAQALEKAGHSVWWDRHIAGGAQYGAEIEEALKRADAVVVLWSATAIHSAWVRDEAAAGRDAGKLVPARLDVEEPPMGFRQYQTIDLSRWNGQARSAALASVIDAVETLVGRTGPPPKAAMPVRSLREPAPRRLILAILGSLALLAAGFAIWRLAFSSPSTPVVAVVSAKPDADSLARDLLVQLGSLHAAKAGDLELVGGRSRTAADVIFEVGIAGGDNRTGANIVLLGRPNSNVLWSRSFEQPSDKASDLHQQLAYTSAQVLECALEATHSDGRRLPAQTLKLYLNSCADFAEGADPDKLVQAFMKVTREVPKFQGGWAKLLVSEVDQVSGMDVLQESPARESLKRHIAQARKLYPSMPETLLAEAALLPENAYQLRLGLADRGTKTAPENSQVLNFRSNELMTVGRMREAVADAEKAALLDPLSPVMSNARISALAYSGRPGIALEALKEAQRRWPGASTLEDVSYRFHLRYGDPHEALRILRATGASRGQEAFLLARIEPSQKNIDRVIEGARATAKHNPTIHMFAQVLVEFRREDELFKLLLSGDQQSESGKIANVLFRPGFDRFRKDRRFMQVAARIGLLDYWQASRKWPDFCFEPDLPYDCQKEAGKLS